ncbi:MAG: J domain-containing protein [Deltaproteobacteria bacterium]|nr:J domain-containing protein [Deltaproteobacteria bacterium]
MLPADIPGLGGADEAPTLERAANLGGSGVSLTPEDYFVLSRVDGKTSLRQICQLMAGMMAEAKVVDILRKLKGAGAITVGAATAKGTPPQPLVGAPAPAPVPGPSPGPATPGLRQSPPMPPRNPTPPTAEAAKEAAIAEAIAEAGKPPAKPPGKPVTRPVVQIDASLLDEPNVDLEPEQKRRILEVHALLSVATHFELLEVATDADKKDIKRSYFKLSKEFHPDRFYKRALGSYVEKLAEIFKGLNHAFEVLSDDGRRAAYVLALKARARTRPPQQG